MFNGNNYFKKLPLKASKQPLKHFNFTPMAWAITIHSKKKASINRFRFEDVTISNKTIVITYLVGKYL